MRKKYIIAGSVLCVAIGVIIFNALSSCSVKSYTVGELLNKADSLYEKTVRVEGKVGEGSIVRSPEALRLEFILVDENEIDQVPVSYQKVEPDNFYEGRGVVVEGMLDRDGRFSAEKLYTSCASKYVPEE